MIEEYVHFYADDLRLEGVLTYHEDSMSPPAILICPPHPNLGGDMENNVITSLARVSAGRGFASLRFNYRGVGKSESREGDIAQRFQYWEVSLNGGSYADAVADARAALDFLSQQLDVKGRIFIAGYSFGAITGMHVGVENKDVVGFACISTPFGRYDLDYLRQCGKEKAKLFIYNQDDFATTEAETLQGFEGMLPPKTLELIGDSDHFYRTQEDAVSRKVCEFFEGCLRGGKVV